MAPQPFPEAGTPDPGRITSQQDFGRELTLARERAGLTVRQVARASGIPPSTAGDYFAARHLPPAGQPDLLPRVLGACGITGEAQVRPWQDAVARIRRSPGRRPARGPAPYRGLASFQAEDTAWFFGREELVLHLVRLATGVGAPGLPLAVVGPSGSGKSSLLRAGLIPRLRTAPPARPGGRPVVLITPGDAPLQALAEALAPVAPPPGQGGPGAVAAALRQAPDHYAAHIARGEDPPAIIVDQFEETFASPAGEAGRQEFVTALLALSGTTLVVLGLRADFYGHALRYPALARSLQDRQIVVSPMSAEQLRRAIVEPAQKAGLSIEDGLVELLLADMRPPAAPGTGAVGHEPGALPLLSHALRATWEGSQSSRLTVAGYHASGGIRDAIARTAEAAYGTLTAGQQETARHLFLRLVHIADDTRETRVRLPLSDLPGDPATSTAVLERFVARRLVTLDATSADITHEALLDAWPRLRAWLDADREDIRVRRFIATAAQAWAEAGQETAALLRGGQLALARDWAANEANRALLNRLARDFIDAGVAGEREQQAAQRRRTRRLRQFVGALTVLVLVTVGLAGYAFQQRQLARTAQQLADSRSVAIEANEVRADDPALAAQLSLAAYRIRDSTSALASLLESSGAPLAARMYDSDRVVQGVALSPDHRLLAVVAADGTLRLWNVASPGHPAQLRKVADLSRDDPLYAVAFSPDGRLLAAAGADDKVRLWDVAGPGRPVLLGSPLTGPKNTVYSLAFSPDGLLLAAGGADDTVRLWNLIDPAHPAAAGGPLTGAGDYIYAVAFSPDGHLLAAGSADDTVRLWDVADPAKPRLVSKLAGPGDIVDSVAFSPDGQELAAGGHDDKVWLWRLTDPAKPVLRRTFTGATDWIMAVAFSPDGRILAGAGSDGQLRLWNAATGAPLAVIPHPQPVTSLAWDGTGLLFSADADGYVRAWHLPTPDLDAGSPVNSLAYSPVGQAMAVGASDLQLWNPATRTLLSEASVPGGTSKDAVNAVAFSPDGHLIAAGYDDGRIQLWRAGNPLVPLGARQAAARTTSGTNLVEFVAFSADGKILASGSDDGTIRLWDITDPARPTLLHIIGDPGGAVYSLAFGQGGHVLAAASIDDEVRLWNVTRPTAPAPLGRPLDGPTNTAYTVAFSPDGHTLAIGSADRDVRLWDVTNPARPHRIGPTLTGPSGYVYSVAFAPGGHTLAAGNTDGSVWLWNLTHPASPSLIATLTGPSGHVYSVAFSPGGHTIAATDSSNLVWLWDTRPSQAAAAVCATSGQPLTRAEWHTYVPGLTYAPPCPSH